MTTITQNTTNNLIFYVTSSLATPYYLVRLVSKITGNEFAFILTDSSGTCDFISCQFIEVGYLGVDDAVNGEMALDSGSYKLYLYDQSSSSNLDYTSANELLLEDDCNVISDDNNSRIFK